MRDGSDKYKERESAKTIMNESKQMNSKDQVSLSNIEHNFLKETNQDKTDAYSTSGIRELSRSRENMRSYNTHDLL